MDKNEDDASGTLKTLCQLSTRQLLTLTEGLSDELLRRALKELDTRLVRLYHLGVCDLVTLRGRLRMVRAHELEKPSAAPEPAQQRVAADVGAPKGDTTTSGAADSLPYAYPFQALPPLVCERCKVDIGHEGDCRPVEGPETAPLSPSPSHSELPGRGPRGPEAAEGAGEAGRAKQGPVDLAHHLAVLKGGAA